MKFGSLFSGIGGFDLGLERAGMQCAWQVEIEPHCQKLLEQRFPNVKRYADVKQAGRSNLESVDLICGGFPCQDLSVAGKRAGLVGERSGLWFEFARVIDELEPRWVVIENVPGLLSSNRGRDFATIVQWLVKRGYGVCWRILDARHFGVAQRRRRVFIIASFGNGRAAQVLFESEGVSRDSAKSRETRQGLAGTLGSRSTAGGFPGTDEALDGYIQVTRPLTAAMGTKWNGNGDLESSLIPFVTSGEKMFDEKGIHRERIAFDVTPTLNAFDTPLTGNTLVAGGHSNNPIDENLIAQPLRAGRQYSDMGDGQSNIVVARSTGAGFYSEDDAASVRAQQGGTTFDLIAFSADRDGGDATEDLSPTLKHGGEKESAHGAFKKTAIALAWQQGNPTNGKYDRSRIVRAGDYAGSISASRVDAVAWHENKGGQLTEGETAKALGAGASHSYQGIGVRRLTPTECERLQGFPDDWTEGQADSTRYRQLGNAVCVPVITWLGLRIMGVE